MAYKIFTYLYETRYKTVFEVADSKFEVKILKFKMADQIWQLKFPNFDIFV